LLLSIAAALVLLFFFAGPAAAQTGTADSSELIETVDVDELQASHPSEDTSSVVVESRGSETNADRTQRIKTVERTTVKLDDTGASNTLDTTVPGSAVGDALATERVSFVAEAMLESGIRESALTDSGADLDGAVPLTKVAAEWPRVSSGAADPALRTWQPQSISGLLVISVLLNGLLGMSLFLFRFELGTVKQWFASESATTSPTSTPEQKYTVETSTDKAWSDEEVVRHLLEENDGQMRQSEIVDSTDWSKAKVSRLLAGMESNGDIVKVQLGRQNLICLEGSQPEITKPLT
jgi:uncharacterized membrane protein